MKRVFALFRRGNFCPRFASILAITFPNISTTTTSTSTTLATSIVPSTITPHTGTIIPVSTSAKVVVVVLAVAVYLLLKRR